MQNVIPDFNSGSGGYLDNITSSDSIEVFKYEPVVTKTFKKGMMNALLISFLGFNAVASLGTGIAVESGYCKSKIEEKIDNCCSKFPPLKVFVDYATYPGRETIYLLYED